MKAFRGVSREFQSVSVSFRRILMDCSIHLQGIRGVSKRFKAFYDILEDYKGTSLALKLSFTWVLETFQSI